MQRKVQLNQIVGVQILLPSKSGYTAAALRDNHPQFHIPECVTEDDYRKLLPQLSILT